MKLTHGSAAAIIAVAIGAAGSGAQCRPPANSHEARLLAFYEAPFTFSMAGAPARLAAGSVRVEAEAVPVPSPDAELQHPSYCYQYTTNNTRLAPLFGRPRLTIGLPANFSVEASYLPPITVGDARATVASFALERTQTAPFSGGRLELAIRAHTTVGKVLGPITCPRQSLQLMDEAAPCYGTEPSRDAFHPDASGIEAALGTSGDRGRVAAYVGGGISALRPRFRAGFTDGHGLVDRTTVAVDLIRGVLFGGATFQVSSKVALAAQLYSVPADVTTLRLAGEYRIR